MRTKPSPATGSRSAAEFLAPQYDAQRRESHFLYTRNAAILPYALATLNFTRAGRRRPSFVRPNQH
jgi:hypothetical protein